MRFATAPIILGSVLLLAACGDKPLHDLDARRKGPDEFLVLPNKPLEQPASYAQLPTPTPGGANLTDRNPRQEAIVALGEICRQGTGTAASSRRGRCSGYSWS